MKEIGKKNYDTFKKIAQTGYTKEFEDLPLNIQEAWQESAMEVITSWISNNFNIINREDVE